MPSTHGPSVPPDPDADPTWVPRLVGWFGVHARELPWRGDRTPYRVWIAEVMLQQTRVDTVLGYYARFLARFPDLPSLATAPLEAVLKAWEGLGYYRRARHLHAAARDLHARGRALPSEVGALQELPGFGPYTSAAVATFAFGAREVPVDGNVRRVGARLFGLERPTPRAVQRRFAPHQPADDPAAFAEALIELGATVCTPRTPRCDACPLANACVARAMGAPEAFPDDPPRRPVPTRRRMALVYVDEAEGGPRVWLRRRDAGELLPGMWGFVQVDADEPGGPLESAARLEPVRHTYSHFRLELIPVRVGTPPPDTAPLDADALRDRPLSRVDRRVLAAAYAAGWTPHGA